MKLKSQSSIFNMGDTSLRVKKIVDTYFLLLRHLEKMMPINSKWEKNYEFQENFYQSLLQEIERLKIEENISFAEFKREEESKSKSVGKRGRTWTNPLVKMGLVHRDRTLSSVGKAYLFQKLKSADALENLLDLDENNLVYFRQLLKMRIYSHQNTDTLKFFYNFRFAMLFLNQYDDVPRHDFLHILESISPEFTKEDLDLIITAYKQVVDGIQSFEEYYNQYFAYKISTTEDIDKVKQLFLSGTISKENLVNIFKNGKSPQPLYADFVLNIIELIDKREVNSLTELKKLSKLSIIKKAFGLNKMPFKFTNGETVSEFLEQNADNSLLSDNHYEIYLKFISSKRFDLIREYSDMCQRIFSVTGMISFSKGLVNLNNKWLMKPLLEQISNRFILCGHGNYEKYEENINSSWFADISLCEIFEISEKECQAILRGVQKDFDISDVAHIKSAIRGRKEEEYRTFVAQNFPKEKLIEVLEHISSRNDNQVFNLVTDNATIPTIFEYILTIAWYHISKRKFYLKQAFQVSLDGNKLLLTHRGSGAGDIEILTKDYALLIEATLMDKNTQKRGELEPVIRHSINFNLQHFDRVPNIQTLFIANELDGNVINLFRAVQFIELNGTLSNKESVNGISIFALTTTDIIIALKNDLNDEEILSRIKEQRMKKPDWIKSDWYQSARCTVLGV